MSYTKIMAGLRILPVMSKASSYSRILASCSVQGLLGYQMQANYSKPPETVMNVFNRNAKRLQRNRTALLPDYKVYDYLKDEVGWRVADRIMDVKRKFDVAVDLGCGRGHVSKHILDDMVGALYMCDFAEKVLEQSETPPDVPTFKIHVDEEFIPFKTNSIDLVVSSLNMHWVNDLPGSFKQIHNSLKNDGCFIGAMYGGDTLFELRCSLQLAETEIEGGFGAHVSPFTSVQDLGNLLTRAGYTMLTIDIDEMVINYPSMKELMWDLKGMGENNAAWNRKPMLRRETMKRAMEIYKEMYGSPDQEGVPATFQIIYFIGWKPDPSHRKAAARGSGELSIKDIDKLDQIAKQIEDMKGDVKDKTDEHTLDDLTKHMENLRAQTIHQPPSSEEDDKHNKDK